MKEDFKSGFAAIIGRPNVGKSTLMNHLIGQKIAITSRKPQTTRNRIQTVYTCEKGQIVFLDTPGIHKAKNKLGEYMVNVAQRTFQDADVILWLVEASDYIGSPASCGARPQRCGGTQRTRVQPDAVTGAPVAGLRRPQRRA